MPEKQSALTCHGTVNCSALTRQDTGNCSDLIRQGTKNRDGVTHQGTINRGGLTCQGTVNCGALARQGTMNCSALACHYESDHYDSWCLDELCFTAGIYGWLPLTVSQLDQIQSARVFLLLKMYSGHVKWTSFS